MVREVTGLRTFHWNARSLPPGFHSLYETEVEVSEPWPYFGMACGGPRCGMPNSYSKGTTMASFRDTSVSVKARCQHKCMPCVSLDGN